MTQRINARRLSRAGRFCLAAIGLVLAGLVLAGLSPASAEPTPPQPGAAQPTLPKPGPSTPVVDDIARGRPSLEVRTHAARPEAPARRRYARAHGRGHPIDLERPALAGVLLVDPITPPVEAPRPSVPMPAYVFDGIASALTIPAPPLVCEHRRRDRALPDPRLDREVPLVCGYDVN